MATPEQLAAALDAMRQQMETQAQQQQAQMTALNNQLHATRAENVALQGRIEQLAAQATAQTAGGGGATTAAPTTPPTGTPALSPFIDRAMGKPETFQGEPPKWKDWSIVFRSYATAVWAMMAQLFTVIDASTTR